MEWGDCSAAMKLILAIPDNTETGGILGNGAAAMGRHLGVAHLPVVKGQAMSADEPRAIRGTGVTCATSPQGGDHTAGLTIGAKVNHLDPAAQRDVSLNAQLNMAGYDTIGPCTFAGFGYAATPDAVIRRLLRARYGWENLPENILQDLGKQTIRMEREFNRRAGFTAKDDRPPEWMTKEPLPPHNSVFDVPDDVLDDLFKDI